MGYVSGDSGTAGESGRERIKMELKKHKHKCMKCEKSYIGVELPNEPCECGSNDFVTYYENFTVHTVIEEGTDTI